MGVEAGARPLIEVKNLKKYFPVKKGILSRVVGQVKAVDDVSFFIAPGETLGLVGESGCGKTTVGRSLLRLTEPDEGQILFEGKDLRSLSNEQMRNVRARLQIMFQDPFSSLNPRLTVGKIVAEPLENHTNFSRSQIREQVASLLEKVGLQPDHIQRYPHEFSGGQRQRIGVARALALNPKLLICDEPVSALDVSIQAQVINLLVKLQDEMGLSYLFIAHDLSVVEHISDRVAVMYLGKIVEIASDQELYQNPQHPYTKALLSAVPVPDPEHKAQRILLKGDVPSPLDPPPGCAFQPRCPARTDICMQKTPDLKEVHPGHQVACHTRL
ncbi:MAG: dipeptide ABC transporter ATP-binding protein [Desulfarculaceae bacterium]|jgi:oligopeptide/dipeptide ABC transporter ATP-binding protein